ncbi:MAG: HPF/RaiA family ribosome-associated protein [Archangium sp.]|nr:HPF/RaiA family ribosome-associated protein [Archangium sp.]MDP3155233.1 HPF/RaiA family ribosome-associated protein [Archangium sp.]MDP3570894.1 HPF/RaiA family ribosome-associated protein [Archangium sp.]
MLIQINTDSRVRADAKLREEVETAVNGALGHVAERISRVEVHLGDESGNKQTDDDKRCMMEARIEGRPPSAVTQHASSLTEAIDGAADKLRRSVESTLDKANDRRATDKHG